jgi:hypothetical protein
MAFSTLSYYLNVKYVMIHGVKDVMIPYMGQTALPDSARHEIWSEFEDWGKKIKTKIKFKI